MGSVKGSEAKACGVERFIHPLRVPDKIKASWREKMKKGIDKV